MKRIITLLTALILMITPCYAKVVEEVLEPTASKIEENTQAVVEKSPSPQMITTADNLAFTDPSLYETEWGGTSDSGFTWGLQRLAKVLERNCGTPCTFKSAQQINATKYVVTIESSDLWRNGNFEVSIIPLSTEIPQNVIAGYKLFNEYDGWFGYYDRNTQHFNEISHIGNALYKKIRTW